MRALRIGPWWSVRPPAWACAPDGDGVLSVSCSSPDSLHASTVNRSSNSTAMRVHVGAHVCLLRIKIQASAHCKAMIAVFPGLRTD
eukprot:UN2288